MHAMPFPPLFGQSRRTRPADEPSLQAEAGSLPKGQCFRPGERRVRNCGWPKQAPARRDAAEQRLVDTMWALAAEPRAAGPRGWAEVASKGPAGCRGRVFPVGRWGQAFPEAAVWAEGRGLGGSPGSVPMVRAALLAGRWSRRRVSSLSGGFGLRKAFLLLGRCLPLDWAGGTAVPGVGASISSVPAEREDGAGHHPLYRWPAENPARRRSQPPSAILAGVPGGWGGRCAYSAVSLLAAPSPWCPSS